MEQGFSTFWTFILAISAMTGTLMLITSPSFSIRRWMKGKTHEDIDNEVSSSLRFEPTQSIVKGGVLFLRLIASSLFTLVIEPGYVFAALINDIGNQTLAMVVMVIALIAMAITIIAWTKIIITILKQLAKEVDKQRVEPGVDELKKEEARKAQKMVKDSDVFFWLKTIVFSIPTIYLWYLLFVSVGWIGG